MVHCYKYIANILRGISVVKVLNCNTVVSVFELEVHYYVHFWNYTPRKYINSFIHTARGYIIYLMFYKYGFDFK